MNQEQGAEEWYEERQQHRPRAPREARAEEQAENRQGHGQRREHQDQVREVGGARSCEHRAEHTARGSDVGRGQVNRQGDAPEGRDSPGEPTRQGDARGCGAPESGAAPPGGGEGGGLGWIGRSSGSACGNKKSVGMFPIAAPIRITKWRTNQVVSGTSQTSRAAAAANAGQAGQGDSPIASPAPSSDGASIREKAGT